MVWASRCDTGSVQRRRGAGLNDWMRLYGAQRYLVTAGTETVILRQPGQIADASFEATVGSIKSEDKPSGEGTERVTSRDVLISTDPASGTGGFADPGPSAHLVIQGVPWAIDMVVREGGGIARLRCVRREPTELSRNDYRMEA